LTLNLAVRAGQEILATLAKKADVLVDNFQARTLAKWGFTDAMVRRARAATRALLDHRLRFHGPKAAQPGLRFRLAGRIRTDEHLRRPGSGPTKYGVAIVDVCTGMLACNSILAALNARHRTGRGQKVEVSLYESSLAMLANVGSNYLASGKEGGRYGNGHASIVPYTTYPARRRRDGHRGRQRHAIRQDVRVLGHPEWAQDARFARNRDRVANREAVDA